MTLPLILADQRLAERRGIKAAIFGRSGIGKTSLLWTLNPGTTLFFDLEAGDLAIEGWSGDTIRPRTWEECRDFAVFIGGPNPAIPDGRPYSQRHYNDAVAKYGDPSAIEKYASIFVDSITVAGRLCFQWAKEQPEAFSEKTGKSDIRGAYVRQPEGNGVAERTIRMLKEQLLWVRFFATVEELRLGLATFATQYNDAWLRQRHGHKTPNQIRAEQRGLAANVATGLKMAA